jgi:hypothetical protein
LNLTFATASWARLITVGNINFDTFSAIITSAKTFRTKNDHMVVLFFESYTYKKTVHIFIMKNSTYIHYEKQYIYSLWKTAHIFIMKNSTYIHYEKQYIYSLWKTVHIFIMKNSTYIHYEKQYIYSLWKTAHIFITVHLLQSIYSSINGSITRQTMQPMQPYGSPKKVALYHYIYIYVCIITYIPKVGKKNICRMTVAFPTSTR